MKTQHTPGPWKTDKDQKGLPTLVSAHGRGLRQFICDLDTESYTGSKSSIGIEERIANARLITAAPDLLDALEDIDILIGEPEDTIDYQALIGRRILEMWPRIQSAINKAKGE